ncbi:MAG: EamA family transporter [Candidatus Omnitrophica bacterium]|nr:EamA family transporter [Candidatus Omnitrophota bacterium]
MTAFLWAILCACIWGVVPIMEKAGLGDKVDPFVGLFYRSLGVVIGIILLKLFVVKTEALKAVDAKSIILLVLSGLLASFIAQIAFYHALKIGEVSKVVPIAGTYYLITFVIGIVFMGEAVTATKVIAMGMIVAGAWLLR